jgi:hypothetical protein
MIEGVITHECKANIQINLHYDGYDGAQGSFDAIEINDDPAPVGRCCYGDPQDPSCADNTQAECDGLGGDWDNALDCTEDCPAAGENDLCTGAVPMVDGGTYGGTTAGSTVDCPGVLDWNAVWFSFELTECASVTMDYCYTPSPQEVLCLGVVIYDECPEDCPNYILYTSNEWLYDCGTPTSNPRTHFDMLNAGTYYYPLFMGDAGCAPIEAPFAFDFHVVVCPQAQEGDYCDMPILVEIPADMRAEYVDFNTTCGRLDYYSNTCLGYYDGGEDIIYEVTVTEEVTVDVLVDPDATYSGFAIDDGCPLDASTCLGVATAGYSSDEYGFYGITIAPGTYYIMVDTWPSPACVDFKLTIRDPIDIGPGNTCEDPIMVKIPADLPYADLEQQTCLRNNDYASSCLGSYDNGDDAIYEIDVTEQTAVIITLDPKGSTWTGIALDDACPPASSCLAYVTGSSGSTLKVIEYTLDVGTYWIMVDTWPSPYCISDFDLTIDIGPAANWTPMSFDFGTVDEGTSGSELGNIANTGGGNLVYAIEVEFTPPREIDGAYVEALDAYKPGMTMDIEFHAVNASSDAEWIDEIVLDFPPGCDIITSTDMEVIGSTRYLAYEGQTGDGADVVYWNWNGGYGNMYSTDEALATITIAFAAAKSGDITIPYTMSGDDWGDPPHDISGTLVISEADPNQRSRSDDELACLLA